MIKTAVYMALFALAIGDASTVDGYRMGKKVPLRVKELARSNLNEIKKHKPLMLQEDAAAAYERMRLAHIHEVGFELTVLSAFRSYGEQKYLRDKYGPGRAAAPGYSNHQLGLAIDVANVERFIPNDRINMAKIEVVKKVCHTETRDGQEGWRCPTQTFWWLYENAKRFGFYRTVDNEPWHWEYIPGKE